MSELLPSSEYDGSHQVGYGEFWLDVYRLLCCFLASPHIAAIDGPNEPRSLRSRERNEASQLLIRVATYYRVKYEDGSWEHAKWLHDGNFNGVGALTEDLEEPIKTKRLDFKEACNKIIHARRVHFDGELHPDGKVQFLNPLVHLYGTKSKQNWKATLEIVPFCQAAANVII